MLGRCVRAVRWDEWPNNFRASSYILACRLQAQKHSRALTSFFNHQSWNSSLNLLVLFSALLFLDEGASIHSSDKKESILWYWTDPLFTSFCTFAPPTTSNDVVDEEGDAGGDAKQNLVLSEMVNLRSVGILTKDQEKVIRLRCKC